MIRVLLTLLCVCAFTIHADSTDPAAAVPEKPAIELGGIVTADFYSLFDSIKSPHLEIGYVELGATVNISPEVIAAISIAAEENLAELYIRQAVVSYKPAALPTIGLLFGQMQFNHGLLTTRLISDPLIIANVEQISPGLSLNFSRGSLCAGAGLTIKESSTDEVFSVQETFLTASGADSIIIAHDEVITRTQRDYTGILNIDMTLPAESFARLSSLLNRRYIDLDLAFTANVERFSIDGEFWHQIYGQDNPREGGYFLGISMKQSDALSISIRHDGISADRFKELTTRYGGGIVINVKDGIYWACEIAHVVDQNGWSKGYQEIALQIGLQQTLQLPGFQRRTLTTE